MGSEHLVAEAGPVVTRGSSTGRGKRSRPPPSAREPSRRYNGFHPALDTPFARYALALVAALAAAFLKIVFASLTDPVPFFFYFVAVTATALVAGRRAGLACAGFSALLYVYSSYLIEGVSVALSGDTIFRVAFFVAVSGGISLLSHRMRDALWLADRYEIGFEELGRNLENLITSSPVAVICWDREGVVTRWNEAAEELFGWEAREVLGTPPPLLLAGEDSLIDRLRASGGVPVRVLGLHRDGAPLDLSVSCGTIHDPAAETTTTLALFNDVSSIREQEAAYFRSIFEQSLDGLIVANAKGEILTENRVAQESLGYSSEELRGASIFELFQPPDNRPDRVFRHPPDLTSFSGELRCIRKDGTRFPAELSASEFETPLGQRHIAVFFRDVTQRHGLNRRRLEYLRLEQKARLAAETAERRAGYLAQVTGGLATTLDYEETIQKIANLSVQGFASFCIVYLLEKDGTISRKALAHSDPHGEPLMKRLAEHPILPEDDSVFITTVRSGQSLLLTGSELRIEELLALNEDHRGTLSLLEPSSAMLVPLRARGRVLGTIGFFKSGKDNPPFTDEDLRVAETLAQSAAFSIENARLYRKAKDATREREEFLSVVAHDLRSPLGAISVSAEMLLQFDVDETACRYHLEIIQRASGRMSRLIQDLVDAARIESGRLAMEPSRHSVAPILEEACELFVSSARSKRLTIESSVEGEVGEAMVDRYRILQVLTNLIENAVKFASPGGAVRVTACRSEGAIEISVSDTGPGIAPEDLERVFDRFWQAKGTDGGGAGLGLAISRGIVEGHGGRMWVESRLGVGSAFRFTVPAAAATARNARSTKDEATHATIAGLLD
jgi:PAS domain S-box-containing protein